MDAFRESIWYWVAAAILLASCSPSVKSRTGLDRLTLTAKFAMVVAMGAVVFTVALLLNA